MPFKLGLIFHLFLITFVKYNNINEVMKTLLLEGKSASTIDLIESLAHELGIKTCVLNPSEKEDIKLGLLMKSQETGEFDDENDVIKILNS